MGMQNVLSLSDQLEFFKEYITKLRGIVGEERTKTIIATSTYIVSAGNNDIAFTYFISKLRKLHYDVPSYTQLLVSWASNFLKVAEITSFFYSIVVISFNQ